VLILKKTDAQSPEDFKPISLINSIHKIFSKIMANGIKGIQFHQCRKFCARKKYYGGIFIYAQEIIARAKMQHQPITLLKADIYKAFDMISSNFIDQILKAKGFPIEWAALIQRAILQGTSRVILNSVGGKSIKLSRGVR
jgi:Reverse transcriptase (RNA-dependent DNA polymerase)